MRSPYLELVSSPWSSVLRVDARQCLWMRVSLPVACRPGVQEGADNRDVAVELFTPDAVASARDMGDLELRHLLLHRGGHLWPNHRAAVKVGGDQERGTGDAWQELRPGDAVGRLELCGAQVEPKLCISPRLQLGLRPS